jgi:cell shape-determining protein MreC
METKHDYIEECKKLKEENKKLKELLKSAMIMFEKALK